MLHEWGSLLQGRKKCKAQLLVKSILKRCHKQCIKNFKEWDLIGNAFHNLGKK